MEVEKMIDNAIKSPIIRHFETQNKPWLTNRNFYGGDLQNFNDFWFFAKMTDFYDNIKLGCIDDLINKRTYTRSIELKLFNKIPFIKIIEKNDKIYCKLFNFISLLKINKR